MRLGISSLLFNLDEALELCKDIKRIEHIEVGIDNLDECLKLCSYKDKFNKLNLSLGIHLPMELNSCENIKYIRNSWVDFINKMEYELKDLNIDKNVSTSIILYDELILKPTESQIKSVT